MRPGRFVGLDQGSFESLERNYSGFDFLVKVNLAYSPSKIICLGPPFTYGQEVKVSKMEGFVFFE